MNDPMELVMVGGSSLTVGGFLMGLLKWSSGRNITQLDATIKELHAAVKELSNSVHEQRIKDAGYDKDLQALRAQSDATSQALSTLTELTAQRIEGLGKFWRDQFEEQRRVNHARLEKATMDLISAIDAISKVQAKGVRR